MALLDPYWDDGLAAHWPADCPKRVKPTAQPLKQTLYVITDGQDFKVGIAKHVYGRLMGLQTGNPRRLRLVATLTHPMIFENETEGHIHAFLERHRLCGEWFDGSALRVQAIVGLVKEQDYRGIYKMIVNFDIAKYGRIHVTC